MQQPQNHLSFLDPTRKHKTSSVPSREAKWSILRLRKCFGDQPTRKVSSPSAVNYKWGNSSASEHASLIKSVAMP